MSDISAFTGKFKVPKQSTSTTALKVQRRPRESAVCKQCRTSKLRCDRGRPACGNCKKKDSADQCNYDHSVNLRAAPQNPSIAEDRLAHLESLVKELIQNQFESVPKPEIEANQSLMTPEKSPERQWTEHDEHAATNQTEYVGFTHWSAILDEIDGLRIELSTSMDTENDVESPHPMRSAIYRESIFGSPEIYSLGQIIDDFLPQRIDADRLLSLHFQGENFILPFIHTTHFHSQYQFFWENPKRVNPLWLSMLFSIFHLASLARGSTRFADSPEDEISTKNLTLHTAAGQCLVIGEYHRPQEFVVEALLMYAHCKSVVNLDPQRETGVIHSMAVRSAYQLGYHRDPDLFKTFTPFQGEMRRRTWAVCKQLDLMTSFQLGLPSSICLENCDTKQIRNLRDSDFGPNSTGIPPSRPDEDVTRLLWFVVKDRQMTSFAKVCRDALSHKKRSEAEVRELDREIRQMHEMIPDVYKVRSMSDSMTDEPFIIITRIYLDFISQKSFCVLHRRYMAYGNQFSTVSCLNAGKTIVRQFLEMHQELAPGGRLYECRWMLGCYTMNDFLLGTTVLCLFLHSQPKRNSESTRPDEPKQKEVIGLLRQAYAICVEKSCASKDAHRVARIVQVTLRKIESAHELSESSHALNSEASLSPSFWNLEQSDSTLWESDPFCFLQPFSFADNAMADMDWAIFDPSMSFQNL